MSFLMRTTPVVRTAARPSVRLFSTSLAQRKTVTETVTDAAKAVDRKVSDAAVKGIDKGVELKNAAAESTGIGAGEASGKASEIAGQAKGKMSEVAGEAKGKAKELEGEAKKKMS